jgi:hypothetical protein
MFVIEAGFLLGIAIIPGLCSLIGGSAAVLLKVLADSRYFSARAF